MVSSYRVRDHDCKDCEEYQLLRCSLVYIDSLTWLVIVVGVELGD